MPPKDSALYGFQRPKNLHGKKEISSSQSLSFTSQLSSLINGNPEPRSKKQKLGPKKDDIFSQHNRDSAKRAKRDTDPSNTAAFEQKHTTDGEGLDRDVWERSKRKMEEKARLYAAMKRGDIEDADERYAVDFDKKWAESGGQQDASSDEEDAASEADEVIVHYTDEFGRARNGTRADAHRAELAKRGQAERETNDTSDRFTARPAAPANVIYGDTIQHFAFNPEMPVAEQMEELAKKRDKSLTPPPEEHFDGKREVRQKGTGFFHFSDDVEERKRQMEGLAKEREETEKKRAESGKRKANEFLDELGEELSGKTSEP